MAQFTKSVLEKYGIKGTPEVLYNPSYEVLFNEETKPGLTGYDKGQETELGAINVMTGVYTVVRLRISSSLTMPRLIIPYGGILRNIIMITIVLQSLLGRQSRRSQRKNFLTRNCMLSTASAVLIKILV